ncbi:UV DNA damage repair endonuclease UvsE [Pelotomaculum propionicicum]|uniref:UV DNA damage repair endonuclease UvsE n=1 Tax=Pelotomaculum propionicicum TaxID=258475 RepID=UPI003B8077B2
MHIRFGYVAMSVILESASPSGTVTFKTYSKLAENDEAAALARVRRTARENLLNTLRLLRHNRAHRVRVYRFSSKIIPLATHPMLSEWDYIKDLKEELETIGSLVKENKIRVSFHPDHYTLLNSPAEEILQASLKDLGHHCRLLDAMVLDNRARLVIHTGGAYRNKKNALERFKQNWGRLPRHMADRIAVENDDKSFTAKEVLDLCGALSLPMVLDIHHYKCNNEGESLAEILPAVFSTWDIAGLPPKFHISSPKSAADFRSHHDFVNPDDLYPFLKLARELNNDIVIMVEAKQKDRAMFQLVGDLAGYPMVERDGDAALIFL